MNKKGLIYDTVAFIATVVIILILGFLLLFIIDFKAGQKENELQTDIVFVDSSSSTRIVSQHEFSTGEKLYEVIIDKVNSNELDELHLILTKVVNDNYNEYNEPWFYVVNNKVKGINTNAPPYEAAQELPKIYIPNPKGEDISFLIMRITPALRGVVSIDYDKYGKVGR